jgi:alcohol dehydrogenase
MIVAGELEPSRLIGKTIALDDSPAEFAAMGRFEHVGVTVINRF